MATIKTIVDYFLEGGHGVLILFHQPYPRQGIEIHEGGHGKSCDFLLDRDATVVQVSKPV